MKHIKADGIAVKFVCPEKKTNEVVDIYGNELDVGEGWYDPYDSYESIEFYQNCSCGKTHLIRIKGD